MQGSSGVLKHCRGPLETTWDTVESGDDRSRAGDGLGYRKASGHYNAVRTPTEGIRGRLYGEAVPLSVKGTTSWTACPGMQAVRISRLVQYALRIDTLQNRGSGINETLPFPAQGHPARPS